MENTGARKISASEDPITVTYIILKHAAEEHRHAFYLKNELKLTGRELRFAAYLLVTYAIEVRADELYPIYQEALDNAGSKVNVKSIILEEEGHLEEMINQLKHFSPDWQLHAQKAVDMETRLFGQWVGQLGDILKS